MTLSCGTESIRAAGRRPVMRYSSLGSGTPSPGSQNRFTFAARSVLKNSGDRRRLPPVTAASASGTVAQLTGELYPEMPLLLVGVKRPVVPTMLALLLPEVTAMLLPLTAVTIPTWEAQVRAELRL